MNEERVILRELFEEVSADLFIGKVLKRIVKKKRNWESFSIRGFSIILFLLIFCINLNLCVENNGRLIANCSRKKG